MQVRRVVPVATDRDIVAAREIGKAVARELGFDGVDLVVIATAISEVARNIISYAVRGEVEVAELRNGHRRGIEMVARDRGPGIADVERAMQDGYSTGGGLGLGLPGSRRLVDEFSIESSTGGGGTTVTMRKWLG
jgi:serine/threonine-protein kinase RsbT